MSYFLLLLPHYLLLPIYLYSSLSPTPPLPFSLDSSHSIYPTFLPLFLPFLSLLSFLPSILSSPSHPCFLPSFPSFHPSYPSYPSFYFFLSSAGLKYALFDKLLLANSYLLGVGGGVVLVLMWCYTGSLFITIITITTVVCALIIAYFMYIFIYEIAFFPYMNVLTTVIAVGKNIYLFIFFFIFYW